MRIAHVNPDAGTGPRREKGAAVHVAEMRRAFRALGAEVVEVDGDIDGSLQAALERIAEAGLDLVYERYALESGAAHAFARARGIPHVVELNAPLEEEDARHRAGRRSASPDRPGAAGGAAAACDATLREATCVLAVSPEVAEHARARGVHEERLVVEANAVDPERFVPRRPGDVLRAELVPRGSLALGFHGRLRPWHNLDLLLDVADVLLRSGRSVHLVLVGKGDFQHLLRERPCSRHVTIRGWVTHQEVAAHVACFDALPLTYAPDAPFYFSPLKLLEAMAAGVVPVVPRIGGLAEAVEDGLDGLVVQPGSAAALAAAIVRLIDAPDERARLAANARARAERHTWEAVARRVLERTFGGKVA